MQDSYFIIKKVLYETKEEAESELDKYNSKEIISAVDFRGELAILT